MTPEEARIAFEKYGSIRAASKATSIPRTSFRRKLQKLGINTKNNQTEIKKEFGEETGSVTTKSLNIKTLDEALKAANVDLSIWEVDKYVVNSWEMTVGKEKSGTGRPETFTNYQVKVWLKRKIPNAKHQALECLVEKIEKKNFGKYVSTKPKKGDILVIPGLYDMHFGLLAWGKETDSFDYDIQKAEDLYVNAIDNCLDLLSSYEVSQFVLPIGQDFFHINTPDNLTPKGKNRLDVDSRLIKVFETGELAVIKAVEKAKKIAPIKLIWVPGNHDPETSYYLCRVIKAHYSQDPDVDVDVFPTMRKFEKWGKNLLGFTHGSEEPHQKLPTIMADSCPTWWGQCHNKEWLIGHVHKRKQLDFISVDSFGSTTIRNLPSLCSIDAWHYSKGYIGGNKVADILCYDINGLMGYFPIKGAL